MRSRFGLAVCALILAIGLTGSGPATALAQCLNGYGGPVPVPESGCLSLRVRPVTMADLAEIVEDWQIPADATLTVRPSDLQPGPWVTVTYRWG